MIFVIEFKRYITGTDIFNIIINKLCYRKKLYSIILFEINKNLKISFYYTILSFNLAIYLWIEDNEEFLHNIKKIV